MANRIIITAKKERSIGDKILTGLAALGEACVEYTAEKDRARREILAAREEVRRLEKQYDMKYGKIDF